MFAVCFAHPNALGISQTRDAMAAQVAKEIFGVLRVICWIYDPLREETYHSLGLETVCPTILGATKLREALDR